MVTATDGCRDITMEHVNIRVTTNLLIHPLQDRFGSNGGKFFFGELVVQRERSGEITFHVLMKNPLVSIDLACLGGLDRHVLVSCGGGCRHYEIEQAMSVVGGISVKCIEREITPCQYIQWELVRCIAAVLLCP